MKKRIKTLLFSFFAAFLCLIGFSAHATATGITFTHLFSFGITNGQYPSSALTLAPDGNFYGVAYNGGTNNDAPGVIFRINTNSQFTVIHYFNTNVWDGAFPYASLTVGPDDLLYGVTAYGGTNNGGTIYVITTNGTFNQLYSFGAITNSAGGYVDGYRPEGALTFGRDGNIYGTTAFGGNINAGTVFEFSTNGNVLTTLHSFSGDGTNDDGISPVFCQLVEDTNGAFYGTTVQGGTNNYGTVFKISADGTYNILSEFKGTNGINGAYPSSGLNFGPDGNLYGTATEGGSSGDGTIYKISPNGVFSLVATFSSAIGAIPYSPVVIDSNNVLYGTTFQGGSDNVGAVYQANTNGQITTLYNFTGGSDGAFPYGGLLRTANGTLYGTADGYNLEYSGKAGYGSIFSLRDTTSPTLTITAPTANQQWSNAVFSVVGTSQDNVGVQNVSYSVNGAAWTNAVTTNGWTNWTGQITLTPGTNRLQAYATDLSGNISTTGAVSFTFILTTPLTVSTNGSGTISPNYNGQSLDIGLNYSMTATAASGFGFTNWTDRSGNILTNGATLRFLMESNLAFVANFVDITKPTLTITAPTSNQQWSNSVFTATGTAHDNVGASNVFYSLNGSAWTPANTTNSWTNWNAQIQLTPGTNTLQAYSQDGAGNLSTTSSVSFVYILSAPLTVTTNGFGTISPNYNGALLQIGTTYSMTATAASGFGFTNWTDGSGNIVTNGSILKFVMASNLTFVANFVDITKPTLTITNPTTTGERWSNLVFTVSGTAKDNISVSNVLYSLNGSSWSNAVSANNWTNWTAQINLVPGTNSLRAYALDGAGNASTTNSSLVDFVVTNQLQIFASGLGTISPNYSNAWLEVGRNYSIVASPGSGFVVTNWTIATNQLPGSITNNATVQFMMESNLILFVNFADVTKPTLTISSPTAGQHMTNALATFLGKVTDNWGCSNVWYQLNGGTWSPAATTNGFTNWNTTATLVAGTNTFKAFAVDLGGNFSTTNTLSIYSSNTFQLTLNFASTQSFGPNGLQFNLQLSPGLSGQIQASTNLVDWVVLTNFNGTNSTLMFSDPAATNYNQRFYRAVTP